MDTRRAVLVLVLVLFGGCAGTSPEATATPPRSDEPPAAPADPAAPAEAPSAEARAAFLATDGQPPRDRARVACAQLLGGAPFVGPETPRPASTSERAWRLIHEPVEQYHGDRRELVLFASVGGEVVEAHVDAQTGDLETVPVASIDARASEPTCEAPTSCGCFRECVEVVRLGPDSPDAEYRVLGTTGGSALHRRAQCYQGHCARVCDAPGHCVDALTSIDETCTGSCVPAEAPFHCERGPSGCVRVDP